MNDISGELYKLYHKTGTDFIMQLKAVTARSEFHPLSNEPTIFSVGGEKGDDYPNLLNAARKAVAHGFRVYLLPRPKGMRMADFIFSKPIAKLERC